MRISEETRYPHPVLSPGSTDFAHGEFKVRFQCEEALATGRVTLRYWIQLDHPDLAALVQAGVARVGTYVRCQSTYYSSLESMTWPQGEVGFPEGELLDRVYIRPIIWLTRTISDWNPNDVNPEFESPISLNEADIIAIGEEVRLNIGRAKLASVESIFAMRVSDELLPGSIDIDPDGNKVTILAHPEAFRQINALRANNQGRATALAAVYLPAVMELLDRLRSSDFDNRRWKAPFEAKCDALGVKLGDEAATSNRLTDAQKLLNHPIIGLMPGEETN